MELIMRPRKPFIKQIRLGREIYYPQRAGNDTDFAIDRALPWLIQRLILLRFHYNSIGRNVEMGFGDYPGKFPPLVRLMVDDVKFEAACDRLRFYGRYHINTDIELTFDWSDTTGRFELQRILNQARYMIRGRVNPLDEVCEVHRTVIRFIAIKRQLPRHLNAAVPGRVLSVTELALVARYFEGRTLNETNVDAITDIVNRHVASSYPEYHLIRAVKFLLESGIVFFRGMLFLGNYSISMRELEAMIPIYL